MNKYYKFIAIVFVILICSCKGENTKKAKVVESINDEDSITVFDFSANLSKECPIDTLSYDNLIKSVRYIPLETNENSLLGMGDILVRKVAGKFVVSTGQGPFFKMRIFDANGKYISNVFNIGRGRNELSMPAHWTFNDSLKKISITDIDNKCLFYDIMTEKLIETKVAEPIFKYAMLDDGTYVIVHQSPSDPRSGTSELPYMYFLDMNGNVISERYYPSERDISYRAIPNVGSWPYETYILKPTYYGAIFGDVFNDTLYAIKSKSYIRPKYILNRGQNYMPTIDEVHDDLDKKSKKMYFNYITDSPEYLFVSYWYNKLDCNAIWNKKSKELIANVKVEEEVYNKFNRSYCFMPFSFDGFKGILFIDYVTADNKIYVGVNASQLMNVLPDLKDDDNPVIIEITLK